MKPDDLAACVVRVEDAEGRTRGTGFLVRPDLAVTCAHVVKAAGAGPGNPVRLAFHVGGEPVEAEVLPDGYHPEADVAFLRFAGPLPEGARPAVLGPAEGSNGHPYQALGYPQDGLVDARWPQGKIGGPAPVHGWLFPLLQVQGAEVDRGLSGAPVLDAHTGRVVGMLTRYRDLERSDEKSAPRVRYAYAVPAETLRDLCPEPLELHAPEKLEEPPSGRGISVGRDAIQNIFITGDYNQVFIGDYERLRDAYIPPWSVFERVNLERFTGREWLLREVDAFLQKHDRGVFVLEAAAGLGKTAFLAWLARERSYIHHFVELAPGLEGVGRGLKNLAAQLVRAWELNPYAAEGVLPGAATHPDFLQNLLAEAARKRDEVKPGEKIVLVVDALDKAGTPYGQNVLGLPRVLPEGVYLIVSQRPVAVTLQVEPSPKVFPLVAESADNLADMRCFLEKAATWPGIAGELQARSYTTTEFVETLLGKCRGVWIYLHYVLDEIERGERSPLDLEALPEGLTRYYAQFWGRWRDADEAAWYGTYLPLLSTLAAAQEAVPAARLAKWAGLEIDLRALRRVLNEKWRPFLAVEVQDGESCYRLYHASLREFLSGQVEREALTAVENSFIEELAEATVEAHARIADDYLRTWGGLEAGLPGLQEPEKQDWDGGYGIRYLGLHLRKAERYEELRALISGRWAEVKFAHECSYDGFLSDLQLAWQVAEEQGPDGIGEQIRYALMQNSILSQSTIRTDLLLALVSHGEWTPQQGLAYAQSLPNARQRAEALAGLAVLLTEQGPSEEAHLAVNLAWKATCELRRSEDQAFALFMLIPSLPDELIPEALEKVRAYEKSKVKTELLISLLPYLSEGKQDSVQQEIIKTIQQLDQLDVAMILSPIRKVTSWPQSAAEMISRLATDSPLEKVVEYITHRIEEARQVEPCAARIEALAELIPLVSEDEVPNLLKEILSAARETRNDFIMVKAVIQYALPWLALGGREASSVAKECLQTVKAIRDSRVRRVLLLGIAILTRTIFPISRFLLRLGRQLGRDLGWAKDSTLLVSVTKSQRLRLGTLNFRRRIAVTAVELAWKLVGRFATTYRKRRLTTIREANQVYLLIKLIESLPSADQRLSVLITAVNFARRIGDPAARAVILARLMPYIPQGLQIETLNQISDATGMISDSYEQAQVLSEIIPYVAGRGARFQIAVPIDTLEDPYIRAKVLIRLFPYLESDERDVFYEKILQAVEEIGIGEDYYKAEALLELAMQLAPETDQKETLDEALRLVRRIQDAGDRAELLGRAIGVVSPEARLEVFKEAVAAALEIKDASRRAQALVGLASLLSESEQLPFLTRHWQAMLALGPKGLITSGISFGAESLRLFSAWKALQIRVAVLSQLPSDLLWQLIKNPSILGTEYNHIEIAGPWIFGLKGDVWCGLMARLMPYVLVENREKVFSKIQEMVGEHYLNAQVMLAPLMPSHQRTRYLAEARQTARRVWGPQARADALRMIAQSLEGNERNKVLLEALDAVNCIGEEWSRAVVLRWLIPLLPAKLMDRAIEITRGISQAMDRAELLIEIVRCMPEAAKDSLLGEALKTVRMIEDAPPFQAALLVQLIPMLPERERSKALKEALDAIFTQPLHGRAKIASFYFRQPQDLDFRLHLLFGLFNIRFIRRASYQTMSSVCSLLSVTSPESAKKYHIRTWRSPLGQFELNIYTQPKLLSALAPLLPPTLLARAIKMAQSIEDVQERIEALAVLSDQLPHDAGVNLVGQLLKLADGIENSVDRARLLIELASRLPPDEEAAILDKAFYVASSIDDINTRMVVMSEIALRSPPHLQESKWNVICSDDMVLKWGQSINETAAAKLAPLWARMPSQVSYRLWIPALRALSRLPRSQFLSALDALIPVLATLGGQKAADAAANAILDILALWP